MKNISKLLAILLSVAMLMTCASAFAEEAAPIKMACFYGYTGANATTAEQATQGIELMIEIVNEAGGIKNLGGRKIELVKADNQSDESVSKSVAERVLADEDIMFAIGAGSTALLLPMLPVTEKLHVPILTNNSGDSITEQGYQYVFRVCNQIKYINETRVEMLQWLADEQGYDLGKIGMLYLDNDFGQSQAAGALEYYEAVGEIVVSEAYPQGISDLTTLLTKCKAAGVEVLDFVGELAECKLLYTTMDAMNYHPLVVGGGSGLSQVAFANAMGEDCLGIIGASNFTIDQSNVVGNEELMKPINMYLERYGEYPDENALLAFAEMQVAINALETLEGELTRENLRDTISTSSTESYYWTGNIEFDETGNNDSARWTMTQWNYNEETGKYFMSCLYPNTFATNPMIEG